MFNRAGWGIRAAPFFARAQRRLLIRAIRMDVGPLMHYANSVVESVTMT